MPRTEGCVVFEQMEKGVRVIRAVGKASAKALRQERGKLIKE